MKSVWMIGLLGNWSTNTVAYADGFSDWTTRPNEAIKFRWKWEAQLYRRFAIGRWCIPITRIEDHVWLDD